MTRTFLSTAAVAACALLAPTGAHAAGTIFAGPVKVKSYSMTLSATDAPKGDSLSIMFVRTSGKSTQMHTYDFKQGVKVTSRSISASLGKYGSIKLKLGKTKRVKGKLPKGCTGKVGTAQVGTATGSLRFVADSSYFKTVKKKKLTASRTSSSSKITCSGGGSDGKGGGGDGGDAATGPMLMLTQPGPASLTFLATPESQTTMKSQDPSLTAPATISHTITSTGKGLVDITPTTASVPGLSPFHSGQGSFAGSSLVPGMATGPLTGSLVAKFDSIGSIPLVGDDATLMS